MHNFEYPATLSADPDAGGFVVTFRDLPEAITQGEDMRDALDQAADALEEAIANRIAMNLDIPVPSSAGESDYIVPVPAHTAIKAVLYATIREHKLSNLQLAAHLHVDEKEIRRLLDPYHASKVTRVQKILRQLGKRLVIASEDATHVKHHAREWITDASKLASGSQPLKHIELGQQLWLSRLTEPTYQGCADFPCSGKPGQRNLWHRRAAEDIPEAQMVA